MKMLLAAILSFVLTFPVDAHGEPIHTFSDEDAKVVLDVTPLYDIRPVTVGEPSPLTGRVMDAPSYIALVQRLAAAEGERDALKENLPGNGPPWALVAILVGLALGGGVYLGLKAGGAVRALQ